MELDERERDILNCWLKAWDQGDHPLYGNRNYGEVLELVEKLGLERPANLERLVADPHAYFGIKKDG